MLAWFKDLSEDNSIALIVALIGVLGVLIATFGARFFKKPENPTGNNADGNSISGPTFTNSTVNQTIQQVDPDTNKKLDKIITLIEKNAALNTPSSPAETQTLKAAIARLIESQDAQKQHIVATLEQGDLDAAIAKFEALDQQQSQHAAQQIDQAVATKLELAALLTYRDPDKSERLLAQAVKLAPDHLQARNQHGLILMRMGRMQAAINAFEHIRSRSQDNPQAKGVALGNLGLAYARLGQVDKAMEYH